MTHAARQTEPGKDTVLYLEEIAMQEVKQADPRDYAKLEKSPKETAIAEIRQVLGWLRGTEAMSAQNATAQLAAALELIKEL